MEKTRVVEFKRYYMDTVYVCPILTLSFDTDLRSRCFEPVISINGKAYENTLLMVGWH